MNDERAASIIVPAYNSEKTIRDVLKKALAQDYDNVEIIVIDDCSTDNTSRFVKELPVSYYRNRSNIGLAESLNRGVDLSRGDIIVVLQDDCVPKSHHWISQLLSHFKDPEVGAVTSPHVIFPDENVTMKEKIFMYGRLRHGIEEQDLKNHRVSEERFFSTKCDAYRRDILDKVGKFRPISKVAGEDKDLSCRIRKAGYKILMEPSAPVYHLYASHHVGLVRNWKKAVTYGEVVPKLFFLHGEIHSIRNLEGVMILMSLVFTLVSIAANNLSGTIAGISLIAIALVLPNAYRGWILFRKLKSACWAMIGIAVCIVDSLLFSWGIVKGVGVCVKEAVKRIFR